MVSEDSATAGKGNHGPLASVKAYLVAGLGLFVGLSPAMTMFSAVRYQRVIMLASVVYAVSILPRLRYHPKISWRVLIPVLVPIAYYIGYYVIHPPALRPLSESARIAAQTLFGALPWLACLEVYLIRIPRRLPILLTCLFAAFTASTLVLSNGWSTYNCLLDCLPLFLISYTLFTDTDQWEAFFNYFICGALCAAAMGIWHYAVSYLSVSLSTNAWQPLGSVRAAMSSEAVPNLLSDASSYAAFLILGIMVTLGKVSTAGSTTSRWLLGVAVACQVAGLVVSQCRIALIALAIIMLFRVAVGPRSGARRTRPLAVVSTILMVVVAGLVFHLRSRHEGGYSDVVHYDLWGYAWRAFLSHPAFGIGFGNGASVLQGCARMQNGAELFHFHCQYLQILAVGGIVGATMAIVFAAATLARLSTSARYLPAKMIPLLQAFILGLFATALTSTTDLPWAIWKLPFSFAMFLGVFLGSAVRKRGQCDSTASCSERW